MQPRRVPEYSLVVFIFCLFLYLRNMDSSDSWDIRNKEGINYYQTPGTRVYHQDWQPVFGSAYKFAIYSAYGLVDQNPPNVLIIGITEGNSKDEIRCHFHFPNQHNKSMDVPAWEDLIPGKIETLIPGFTDVYAGVFVRCPLPPGRPENVSILVNGKMKLTNMVRIQYEQESEDIPYQYTYSVCVKPMFNFNKVLPLLEWIEFYKLMGVEQFTFYNMSIGSEASCILKALMSGSDPSIKVHVLPWRNNDLLDESLLTDYGNVPQTSIAAAQNDCVYRHRGRRSKYMAFVDLDEFIMPRKNMATNYREMMELLDSQKNVGAYIFQNAFFVLSRPDNPMLLEWCSGLALDPVRYRICKESLMIKKVRREDLYPHKVRSKYIIKPEGVQQASNHFVERFESGYTSSEVPSSIAISRHYREFPEGKYTQEDGISKEFGLKLVGNLSRSVESFAEMCNFKLDSIGIGQ